MTEQQEHDDKIRYPEAAALTGMKLGTLQARVSRREIPHFRLGPRLVVFSKRELIAWMGERKVAVR